MSDRKRHDAEDQPIPRTIEDGDAAQGEITSFGIGNLVEALCEDPFESEAEEEDVAALRAEMLRRANIYADELGKHFVKILCEEPFESESEEEDITALRAEVLRRAKLYAAELKKS